MADEHAFRPSDCSGMVPPSREQRRIAAIFQRAGASPELAIALATLFADQPTPEEPMALLLSDQAAAAMLGVSRATLWRRVRDGTLPRPRKLGAATRFLRPELVEAAERLPA